MNIIHVLFPSTSTIQGQITNCWSMLRYIRKTHPVVQLITNKHPTYKSLHIDCQWNGRSSRQYQRGTSTNICGHSLSLSSNVSALRTPPTPACCFMAVSKRWYVRDRDAIANKSHANKILKDVMPLTTRRVVRWRKSQSKESVVDAKVKCFLLFNMCGVSCTGHITLLVSRERILK